jgi:predicted dehydrogenase
MHRIAVVGAGHWGPNLLRNFHDHPETEVAWTVDTSDARLEQVRARFPTVRTTSRLDDALEDASVDAVVVATPTVTHAEVVRRALERGKHVLVEKPITNDAGAAAELCALAEQKQRVLMVGHVFLFNSAVQRVKKYVQDGELGRVFCITMERTNLGPIRLDVNAAWDLASHDVSMVNYWLDATPLSASAIGGTWINPGVADAVFLTLRYPSDVLVNVRASWLHPKKGRDIAVVGDRRMLTFDDLNGQEPIRIYDKGVADARTSAPFVDSIATFRASIRNGDIHIPNVAVAEPLKNECSHFVDCIAGRTACKTDGRFGLGVVRALEAIDRSIAGKGREEEVGWWAGRCRASVGRRPGGTACRTVTDAPPAAMRPASSSAARSCGPRL